MNIFELFAKAKQNLKWPALHLRIDEKDVKISPSHDLMVLFISNGKGKFNGRITYGYIRPNISTEGKIIGAHIKWEPIVDRVGGLRILAPVLLRDPVKFCSLHGLEFKFCCFCGAELTAKESTFAGYGPICAEKWGLPWGETKDEKIKSEEL